MILTILADAIQQVTSHIAGFDRPWTDGMQPWHSPFRAGDDGQQHFAGWDVPWFDGIREGHSVMRGDK